MNISSVGRSENYSIDMMSKNTNKNHKKNEQVKNNEETKSLKFMPKKNSLIETLKKIKETIIQQKEKLKEEEMTPEMRREKLTELNKKLLDVQKQIQDAELAQKQKEAEKAKKENEDKQKKYNKNYEIDGVIVDESLKQLINVSHHVKNISNLKSIKANMKVEAGYLNQSQSKDPNTDPNAFINRHRAKLENGIAGLEKNISSEIGKINKKVKHNTEEEKNIEESKNMEEPKNMKKSKDVEKLKDVENQKEDENKEEE